MSGPALWITEAEVAGLVDLPEAIRALESGFRAEGTGGAAAMDKTIAHFGDHATLHALGATFSADGVVGTKTWAHTPGGAAPHVLVFDAGTGALVAVIEAFALGQLRTAGTAALATDRLARPDAARLAMVGTGKQALAQVAAVACVRPLSHVACVGRDPEKAARFAAEVTAELGLFCTPARSVADALEGADVLTLATRAAEPVVGAGGCAPGTHVNAIGAIALDRMEFEPGLLARCGVVVTDSVAQVKALSAELRAYYGAPGVPGADWAAVRSLADLVTGNGRRPGAADLTLFKAMGSGVEDLALAVAVLERARLAGAGTPLPPTRRVRPRLKRADPGRAGAGAPTGVANAAHREEGAADGL